MPHSNNFQHAPYSRSNPGERVSYPTFEPGPVIDSPAWKEAMAKVGAQLCQSKVKGIVFLNGHPYSDLFGAARLDEVGGLKRGYSRGISGLESLLALLRPATNGIVRSADPVHLPLLNDQSTHEALDHLALEVGNFTTAYVRAFEQGLCQQATASIPCERYVWSSVHHHLGRVEAAMAFIEYLQEWGTTRSLSKDDRVLLIAHGHAGQVLALLSNLVTFGESEARPRIFELLAKYWEASPQEGWSVDQLEALYQLLVEHQLVGGASLDMVTLGTPVRYGWDIDGFGRLLHVVNHRLIRPDGKRWLSKMELPQTAWEMPYQTGGDYVQQLAVAGTDAVPDTPEMEQANRDFREIFEPYDGFERWLECARRTTRCPSDGHCVLVEYGVHANEEDPRQHLYGHGCYTQSRGMVFLAEVIARSLYS
ncbi:MAG: hypothetical protein OEZ05_13210 [Nitrospirota bacterium]|nr:hypothetical protein [Nitrospirota bacterium]MDH5587576.1 hypothetical protein [Nitrospirota bacterium]